jgi:hypothetical protein
MASPAISAAQLTTLIILVFIVLNIQVVIVFFQHATFDQSGGEVKRKMQLFLDYLIFSGFPCSSTGNLFEPDLGSYMEYGQFGMGHAVNKPAKCQFNSYHNNYTLIGCNSAVIPLSPSAETLPVARSDLKAFRCQPSAGPPHRVATTFRAPSVAPKLDVL